MLMIASVRRKSAAVAKLTWILIGLEVEAHAGNVVHETSGSESISYRDKR